MASVFAIRCENAMESGQIHFWLGHQCGQLANKIQWVKNDMGRTVTLRRFKLAVDIPRGSH